ncbi:mitochondrial 2-enoyl thioester reductase [Polyrhizophydium stewartii]|uniref:enoyl-[acyl-carrier-protein] reductase n=1 Tax=Polyrhizophydium stewartii TaxID=2732419 RepID=A0ABR4NKP3_9FUNG
MNRALARLRTVADHLDARAASGPSAAAAPSGARGHTSSARAGLPTESRALVFSQVGAPDKVLSVKQVPLGPLGPDSVLLKLLAAPVNPADVNVIQGTYPIKPTFIEGIGAVGGNEGVGEVLATGSRVSTLKPGDWVIPLNRSFGLWQTHAHALASDLLKLPDISGVSPVLAATISVNPPTAYRMLKDFGELKPGDVILQNSANSGVGQAVIQLARAWGFKTVNVVRSRPNLDELVKQLKDLGADMVVTEEQLRLPETAKQIAALGPPPKLGLNGVGGKSATNLARLLGDHAYFVTYGGMSKEPVTLPTSLFIFKDLKCCGFWMNKWNLTHPLEAREAIFRDLFELVRQGKLQEPIHEKFSLTQRPERELVAAVSGSLDGFLKGKPVIVP